MSRSENIPRCPCVVMRLIESSHNPLSSGYTYDSVPPGRAVMERDMSTPSELKVAETYIKLIEIIIPRKATPNYCNIFFAKFYEQGGVMSMVAPDLNSA